MWLSHRGSAGAGETASPRIRNLFFDAPHPGGWESSQQTQSIGTEAQVNTLSTAESPQAGGVPMICVRHQRAHPVPPEFSWGTRFALAALPCKSICDRRRVTERRQQSFTSVLNFNSSSISFRNSPGEMRPGRPSPNDSPSICPKAVNLANSQRGESRTSEATRASDLSTASDPAAPLSQRYSTYRNSLLLKSTRTSIGTPCRLANSCKSAASAAVGFRPRMCSTSRVTSGTESVSAPRRSLSDNRSDMRNMNELLSSDKACSGVVVTPRRGAFDEGSGQSSTSRNGFRPDRTHVRYRLRR